METLCWIVAVVAAVYALGWLVMTARYSYWLGELHPEAARAALLWPVDVAERLFG